MKFLRGGPLFIVVGGGDWRGCVFKIVDTSIEKVVSLGYQTHLSRKNVFFFKKKKKKKKNLNIWTKIFIHL